MTPGELKNVALAIAKLRSATLGHWHWDPTGRGGNGCQLCQDHQQMREEADALLKEIDLPPVTVEELYG